MSEVTLDTLIDFLRSGGGQVTYTELKRKFAYFLNDPVNGDANKQLFKELLKKIATTMQLKEGERIISLKDKYREANSSVSNSSILSKHDVLTQNNAPQLLVKVLPAAVLSSKDSGFSSQVTPPGSLPPRPDSSASSNSDSHHKQWLVAISNGDIEMMKTLLNEKPELLEDCDSSLGFTAFHWAAFADNCDLIEFLASKTKSQDAINRMNRAGHTPLHVAYMHNNLAVADLLERRGANGLIEDYNCRQPKFYRMQPRRGQGPAEVSPTGSTGRKVSTLEKMGHLASKLRDKVRSISSSNSSIESISSCSSTSNHRRPPSGHVDGFDSDKGNRHSDTDSTTVKQQRNDPCSLRRLSSSIGALNPSGMQLTPHLAVTHFPCPKSKSSDLSPPLQEPRRKSADLMPPPPRPFTSSRV